MLAKRVYRSHTFHFLHLNLFRIRQSHSKLITAYIKFYRITHRGSFNFSNHRAGNYTHIFIRHTDIDALTAAFCDYRGAIAGRETGEIYAVYLRLSTGIRSLQSMEKLSAGSIF